MIVADTNIIAYLMLRDHHPQFGSAALELYRRKGDWVLPGLWRHEFLQVLSAFVRRSLLSHPQAMDAWLHACRTFSENEVPVDYLRALELSVRLEISACDAQYLALAEAANTVLVTQDKELLKKAPGLAVTLHQALA